MAVFNFILTLFSILFLLVLHEFGHFITARRLGVKVEEFGIGIPPRLFSFKFKDTLYSINLLPFGAFVKIPGLDEATDPEDYKFMMGKPIWQRALILLGGVVSFWIIGAILFSIVFGLGVPQAITDDELDAVNPEILISSISVDSPAEQAGLVPGDIVKKVRGLEGEVEIVKVNQLIDYTNNHKGQEITLTIMRMNDVFEVNIIPRIDPPSGEGAIGIGLVRTSYKSFPWWQAPLKGIETTFNLSIAVVEGWYNVLKSLVLGNGVPKSVKFVGPIGLFQLVNQAAQVGIVYFIQFIAMIAVYLAVFNILPIPALDGGKLLFLAIEKIKGKPVDPMTEQKITAVFFGIFLILMLIISIKDIGRLF